MSNIQKSKKPALIATGDLKGLPKGSVGVDLREKTRVYATAKHPLIKTGEVAVGDEIIAHPVLADDFVKKGYASTEEPANAF